jgi:hypothetical protein
MEHAEFVKQWEQGKLEVHVDRTKTMQIVDADMLPKRYLAATHFWSWVWMSSVPAAFAVMYFYSWWVGLLSLLLVTPALARGVKKSAMQFVIEHALESEEFYKFALAKGVIRVTLKVQPVSSK